ncbi:MAG: histone deacetylase family protein, partial [Gammaproteobacteria bacterium]
PRVLLCSVFQHPAYPYGPPESAQANVIKVPLPAGSDGAALAAAVETHWLPALEAFAPQLLLISAGFDGHREDPQASWRLTGVLRDVARRHAQDRILSTLEGGYALHALGRSVVAHLKALLA